MDTMYHYLIITCNRYTKVNILLVLSSTRDSTKFVIITSQNKHPETLFAPNLPLPQSQEYPEKISDICAKTVNKANTKTIRSIRSTVDTSNFTIEERLVAAVCMHERKNTRTSITQIKRDFRERFGRPPPAKNTLLVWERKLFSTGSVCDAPRPGRPSNRGRHISRVSASLASDPSLSVRARAAELALPRSTLGDILAAECTNKTHGVAREKRKVKKLAKPRRKPPPPRRPLSTTMHTVHTISPHTLEQNYESIRLP